MTWFWLVIFYSFGGYLLEKGYAAAVRSPHRVRKCFLLLPLCPVYGWRCSRRGICRRRVRSHSGGSCSMAA